MAKKPKSPPNFRGQSPDAPRGANRSISCSKARPRIRRLGIACRDTPPSAAGGLQWLPPANEPRKTLPPPSNTVAVRNKQPVAHARIMLRRTQRSASANSFHSRAIGSRIRRELAGPLERRAGDSLPIHANFRRSSAAIRIVNCRA